ncbi:MAG TPA: VWA domain-containing protein, partial [Nitrospira sp.]|nr:VWA domain-containing protein [Nitrospira sp.]
RSQASYLNGMLSKYTLILGLILSAALAADAQSGRQKPTPTPTPDEVKIVTEEVKLNVLAFDEDGKFFKDVTADDLVITEDNIIHQPQSVRRIPANVLIVLDTGGEMRAVKSLDQTRKTASGIVESLRSGDSFAVLQYSDKVEFLTEWTDDKGQALAAIRRAKFGRRSAFVDAIKQATDFMQRSGVDNKHLVLITDGTDSWGRSSERFDAFQRLLGTDISVHVISYTKLEAVDIEPRTKAITNTPPPAAMPPEVVAQLPNGVRDRAQAPKIGPTIITDRKHLKNMRNRKADLESAEEQLGKLADGTNGEMMLPASLEEMVERTAVVANLIDSAYVVTYIPKIPFDENPKDRSIDVTSKRNGLVVQARRRLIAPKAR